MSTAEQWANVLGGWSAERFVLRFDRLGLEAQCRALSAGEVEECLRMGGERGMRYALYLACDDLREAGESLKKQGTVASAFDITGQLSYGDVVAAGAAILSRSGAQQPQVRMDDEDQPLPAAMPPAGGWQMENQPLPAAMPSAGGWQMENQLLPAAMPLFGGQQEESLMLPAAMPLSGAGQTEDLTLPEVESVFSPALQGWADAEVMERNGWISAGQVAREFADHLWAASGNC